MARKEDHNKLFSPHSQKLDFSPFFRLCEYSKLHPEANCLLERPLNGRLHHTHVHTHTHTNTHIKILSLNDHKKLI